MRAKKITSITLISALFGMQFYPLMAVRAADLTGNLGLTGYQPTEDTADVVNLSPNEVNQIVAEQNASSWADQYQTDQFTGAATYRYPLTLPPFRKDLLPELALLYSSRDQYQASWLGYGWSLSWASIQRHQQGGIEDIYAANTFYANIFGHSGELVAYSLNDAEHGEYRLRYEDEPYWKFFYQTDGSWVAINQAGVEYQLGASADTQQTNPNDSTQIYRWMIAEIRDPNDSTITFNYFTDGNQIYPTTIQYGPVTVTLSYSERADTFTQYTTGFAVQTNYLLSTIAATVVADISSTQQRMWTFSYSPGDNGVRSVLTTVTESGTSDSGAIVSLPALTFDYSTVDTLGFTYTSTALPVAWTDGYTNYDTGARVFDINADGFEDIVQSYYERVYATGAEELINHVYLNNRDATWSETSDWSFPEGFVTWYDRGDSDGVRTTMNLIDVNNDGLPDLTEGDSFEQTDQPTYLHTGSGYEANSSWPTAAGWSTYNTYGADMGRRFVDVNGDSYVDMIRSYRYETRASPTPLSTAEQSAYINNPATEDFETSSLYAAPVEFTYLSYGEETGADNGTRLVDVNGDGLVDIIGSALNIYDITTLSDDAFYNNYVYLNNGQGGWELSSWQLPVAVVWTWGGSMPSEFTGYTNLDDMTNTYFDGGVRLIDLNADGLVDIVKSDGFWAQLESSLNTYYFVDTYTNHDSSGAVDYPATVVYLNNGVDGWDEVTDVTGLPTFTDASWAFDGGHRLADANGDGQVDVLYNLDDASFQGVYQNMAAPADLLTTVVTPLGGTTAIDYEPSSSDGSSLPSVVPVVAEVETDSGFGDVTTTAYTYEAGAYHKYDTYQTEFAGFAQVTATGSTKIETTSFDQGFDNYGLRGKTLRLQTFSPTGDLLEQVDSTWEATALADEYWFIALSQQVNLTYDGEDTHRDRAWQYSYDTATGQRTLEEQLGEVTAEPSGQEYEVTTTTDETDNLVAYYDFAEGSGTTTADQTGNGHSLTFNGLATWESGYDGSAASVDWNYEYLETSDHDDFDLGSVYTISAWVNLNDPLYNSRQWILAKKYLPPYSANTPGYYLSVSNQQLEWNICSDDVSCSTTTSASTVPLGSWAHVAVVSDGETVRLYINGTEDVNTTAAIDPGDTADSVVLGANQDNLYNTFLDGSIDEVRIYQDRAYANINDLLDADLDEISSTTEILSTESSVSDILAGDERTITSTYGVDETNWIVTLAEEHTTDAAGNQVSASAYDYDASGNSIATARWLDTSGDWLSTQYTIGDYGLVIATTNPRGYTTTTTYDAYNLYPAAQTNSLSQVTRYAHDYFTGAPTSVQDVNGYTTEYEYDGIGRRIAQAVPDPTSGSSTALATTRYSDVSSPVFVTITTTVAGVHQTNQLFFDGFGYVMQEWRPTEAATPTVVDYWYDDQHNITQQTLPYEGSSSSWTERDTSVPAVTYSYDALNRLTSEQWPVGTTMYTWSQWQKIVINPNGQITTTELDAYDNIVAVDETNGSAAYTTTYTYDALDNVVQMIDAQGNERTFTYDSLARKRTQQDLHTVTATDVGTWQWDFDAHGNQISQIDPAGQTITWNYDSLDRVSSEDWSDDNNIDIAYTYDSATNGVGELAEVVMADSTTSYSYDAQGNRIAETRSLDGITYLTETTYDLLGRLSQVVYPDNALTVEYMYNAAGEIETVTKDTAEDIIIDREYSPAGQVSYQAYANNTATTNTYDPTANYRLTQKVTTGIYDDNPDIDSDGDGLIRSQEESYGTNPNNPDTDADGLTDYDESITYGTNPLNQEGMVTHDVEYDGGGVNVAIGQTVTSAVYENSTACRTEDYPAGCGAASLVDGDYTTLAYPGYTTSYDEIPLDYTVALDSGGSAVSIDSLRIEWGSYGYAPYVEGFEVSGTLSDGTEVILATVTSSPNATSSLVTLSSAAQTLPVVSVNLYAASYGAAIDGTSGNFIGAYELEVYTPFIDSDGDGLSDEEETTTYGTDPTLFDTDGDGIADSISALELSLTPYTPDPTVRTDLTFVGQAVVELTDDAVTGVQLLQVEYSVTGDRTVDWTAASAADGSFDELTEDYTVTLSAVDSGTYTVEVRLVSTVGSTYFYTNNTSDSVTVVAAPPDADNDGVPDRGDRCGSTIPIDGTDTVDSHGCALSQKDTDRDSLNNYQETVTYQTNPLSRDTDGDGVLDGREVRLGRDPNDPLALSPPPQWLLWFTQPAVAATTEGSVQNLSYEYDAVGNIIQITDTAITPTAKTTTYTYDDLDRLLTAESSGLAAGDYSQSYSYDAVGNMTYKSDVGTLLYAGTGNPTPQAVTSVNGTPYVYDANGNVVSDGERSYSWNIKNQLLAADDMNFTYDHEGKRLSAEDTAAGITTLSVNRYLEVQPDNTIYYIWADDVRVASVLGGNITYYYQDHLGSTQLAANASGLTTEVFDYEPYGNTWLHEQFTTPGATYSFSNKAFSDDLGLYYFEARYYNPTIGRFVSQDPLIIDSHDNPALDQPQRWNAYSYALNNPLRYVDPSGRETETSWWEKAIDTTINVTEIVVSYAYYEVQSSYLEVASTIMYGAAVVEMIVQKDDDLENNWSFQTAEMLSETAEEIKIQAYQGWVDALDGETETTSHSQPEVEYLELD